MDSLHEKYDEIHQKLRNIAEDVKLIREEINMIETRTAPPRPTEADLLQGQIARIDECRPKVREFRKIAEDHITSKNLSTIDAPPDYRVNLKRLKALSLRIDPLSLDDPYARKLYLIARCDEKFLEEKREELSLKLSQLEEDYEKDNT